VGRSGLWGRRVGIQHRARGDGARTVVDLPGGRTGVGSQSRVVDLRYRGTSHRISAGVCSGESGPLGAAIVGNGRDRVSRGRLRVPFLRIWRGAAASGVGCRLRAGLDGGPVLPRRGDRRDRIRATGRDGGWRLQGKLPDRLDITAVDLHRLLRRGRVLVLVGRVFDPRSSHCGGGRSGRVVASSGVGGGSSRGRAVSGRVGVRRCGVPSNVGRISRAGLATRGSIGGDWRVLAGRCVEVVAPHVRRRCRDDGRYRGVGLGRRTVSHDYSADDSHGNGKGTRRRAARDGVVDRRRLLALVPSLGFLFYLFKGKRPEEPNRAGSS